MTTGQNLKPKLSLWLVIFIIPAGLMVLLAAYVAGGTTLNCQRVESTQVNCTVSNRRWLGLVDAGSQAVTDLKYARIESHDCDTTDSKGNRRRSTCRNLVLDTGTGPAYFDLLIESADTINTFLAANTSPTLTVQNNRWVFSIAVGVFALAWLDFGWLTKRQMAQARARYSQGQSGRHANGRS